MAAIPTNSWRPDHLRGPYHSGRCAVKVLKLCAFVALSALTWGCASSKGTAFDRDLLLELEEKNARLEAEVTRLREEKLRTVRKSGCSAQEEAAPSLAGAAEEAAPPDLPVVKMAPTAEDKELESGAALVRPAEPLPEEEPFDEKTRPVLKVRGSHEAWVYNRPLTAEDLAAKTDSAPEASK